MNPAVAGVSGIVRGIEPWDDLEQSHIADTLDWISRTDDIYRRAKPAVPPRHLVVYVVLIDPQTRQIHLGHHLKSGGLQLPVGGHVEPLEPPLSAARREAKEEVGEDLSIAFDGRPLLVSVTRTTGPDQHWDNSLWYCAVSDCRREHNLDPAEFSGGRWWAMSAIETADPALFDPHMRRFIAKLNHRLNTDSLPDLDIVD